jgi:hypothetical protein
LTLRLLGVTGASDDCLVMLMTEDVLDCDPNVGVKESGRRLMLMGRVGGAEKKKGFLGSGGETTGNGTGGAAVLGAPAATQ